MPHSFEQSIQKQQFQNGSQRKDQNDQIQIPQIRAKPGGGRRPAYPIGRTGPAWAGANGEDPNLKVATVVSGLSQPIAMAFLGENDFLVTEKATGRVKRVINGAVSATVLDLPLNSASERGLLGI